MAETDGAFATITRLDISHGEQLTALSELLLRAELVAPSMIEHVEASVEDSARAAHGVRSSSSATARPSPWRTSSPRAGP
ncbi:hypothetical protein ACT3SP_08920 [Brachybacterium sp. AOP43-C2-M15]|uniref:hypothetical protein n=1 Tax=Brachybacterium sp. AOP43-C2-M15 TaxID=3457661 RepID=UPI0040341F70